MRKSIKTITLYRVLGITLVVCSVIGYIFVADEIRHSGEFLGVTCLLLAGLLFIAADIKSNVFKGLDIQWISFGLLISIPIGGIALDNMPMGITICVLLGSILAIIFRKKI